MSDQTGTIGLEAVNLDTPVLIFDLDILERNIARLQRYLSEHHRENCRPHQPFRNLQIPLARFAQPELQLQRADSNRVPVAQHPPLHRQAVGGDQGIRLGLEHEADGGVEADLKMFVPDSVLLELEITIPGASDPYRKTAGSPGGARLFAGEYLNLNHYQSRRLTAIRSPG